MDSRCAQAIAARRTWPCPTILMLTLGRSRQATSPDAARCGVAAYLTKPIASDLLEAMTASSTASRPCPAGDAGITRSVRRRLRLFAVLVAEDNVVNQRVALGLLTRRGPTVTVVANGREALDALDGSSSNLVLMDVQMPVMGGLEATAAIRARERQIGSHVRSSR